MRTIDRPRGVAPLVVALLALLLTACGPAYDGLQIAEVSSPPETASILTNAIAIATGTSVRAVIIPIDEDGLRYTEEGDLALGTTAPNIFDVRRMQESDAWLLVGGLPGTAEMLVSLGGTLVERIPVTVVAQ